MVSTPMILGRGRRLDSETAGNEGGEGCAEQLGPQVVSRRKTAPLSWGQNRIQHSGSGDRYDDPAYLAIAQGIYIAWITFLTTTACQPQMPRGARSLMSIALDKTSEYILHEQERLDNLEDKGVDTDVVDHIITELESTYAFWDRGWEPLKELVRAHGIRLMCEAVRKRHLSPRLSRSLILNAASASFYDAAEALLSALLSLSPVIPPPGRLDSSMASTDSYVSALDVYVERTGRRGVWFQETATLISRGAVPVEWMATDAMKPFMMRAIQSVSSDDACSTHSARFLAAVLNAALEMNVASDHLALLDVIRHVPRKQTRLSQARRNDAVSVASEMPQEQSATCDEFISTALTNTVSSILTILCGGHLARFNDATPGTDTSTSMHKLISVVSTTVQQKMELKYPHGASRHFSGLQSLRIGYILMADYLLNCQSCEQDREIRSDTVGISTLVNFERFLGLVSNRGELMGELCVLVLQVSRCCGRAQGNDGFDQVKLLTDSFTATDTSSLKPCPILQAVLSKVAVEVALNFAELTCLRDHHAWAQRIQEKVADLGISSQSLEGDEGPAVPWTPSLAHPATGFRWEDGIGEWVANSPVVGKKRRSAFPMGGMAALVSDSCPSISLGGIGASRDDCSTTSEEESGKEGTAPSSVGDEDEVEEQVGSDVASEVSDRNDEGSSDGNGDTLSDFEVSYPRGKRKSLLAEAVYGANKRHKQTGAADGSTRRQRLRRRRTAPSCTVYRDRDDDYDDKHCEGTTSFKQPTGPVTRHQALRERNLNRVHCRQQSNVEVVIRVPSTAKLPRAKSGDAKSVIPHERWCPGLKGGSGSPIAENHGHRRNGLRHDPEDENEGEDEDEDEDEGADEAEEDDHFINAPVLRDRIGVAKRWSSFSQPQSQSPSSSASSVCGMSRHESTNRQLRPRKPQLRSTRPSIVSRIEIMPCSLGSSDDELSFV